MQPEFEHSKYTFEVSDTAMLFTLFNMYEEEAKKTLEHKLVFPAYDYVLKCSHTFNLAGCKRRDQRDGANRIYYACAQLGACSAQRHIWKNGSVLDSRLLKKGVVQMAKDLLLEIGMEEVPARFVRGAMKQLKDKTVKWLDTSPALDMSQVEAYATPRRLLFLFVV